MNHYVGWLHEVGKLVYIIGSLDKTTQVKAKLDPNDSKNRIDFRCFEQFPGNALKKKKLEVREGILRADWLSKILERYPQMVILLFNCGDQTELEQVQGHLKQILKKINLFMIDVLKANNKEDVFVRVILTLTKPQFSNQLIIDKVNYYLKSYEKDCFIIQVDNLGKDVERHRFTWLSYLQKNYEKKLRKIQRKLEQSISLEKRICYSFKVAVLSQILSKDQKLRYTELYNILKFKFSEITKKQLNLIKYLQIREIRIIADINVLRFIKQRLITNIKEIPAFIQDHMNFFKMRSLDPQKCHFYYYFEELLWRSSFLQQVMEILGATDMLDLLPHSTTAEWLNGLLSYMHRLSTVNQNMLQGLQGNIVPLTKDNYVGRYDYGQITDADVMKTETSQILRLRKDYASKGIQLITRYKVSGLFKVNQINFLNIYLIRFYLAEGKFAAIANIYNEMLKVEVNRCNYYLINELFQQIQKEIPKVDPYSRKLIYGVASLICDYFQNQTELNNYLQLFFNEKVEEPLKEALWEDKPKQKLFTEELSPEAHIFKLKKNSHIFSAKVFIDQRIILGKDNYKIKLKLFFGGLVRARLQTGKHFVLVKFNHQNMVSKIPLEWKSEEGEWIEREVNIEPLYYVHKDSIFHIEQVQLVMENSTLVWLAERSQLIFEKYDSTMFHSNITEPQIQVLNVKKIYYLHQTFGFLIKIKGIEECKVTVKLSVVEEEDGKTQFFINKDDKIDLTNSQKSQQLVIGQDHQNPCWVKCNKLGVKTIKLVFNMTVEKHIEVKWRDKPLHIKSTYSNITRELRFNVLNLFIITKTLRQAVTGNFTDSHVPIHKKMLLAFNVKANDRIQITEITHHNNPRKIKYFKNFKMYNLKLGPADAVQLNILFQLGQDCAQEFDLFLTTLFIKWRREGSPIDNITLDENTIIHPTLPNIEVTFTQKQKIMRRQKASLFVHVRNLSNESNNIYVSMDSSESLMRIGQKGKWKLLGGFESSDIEFSVLCLQAGIFELPKVKVMLNNQEVSISTKNYLVQCT